MFHKGWDCFWLHDLATLIASARVAFSSIAHETKILRGKSPTEATISSQKWTKRWCFHSFCGFCWMITSSSGWKNRTVPGKEHHVVKFRCFDVTEGPENAQIYGAILGSANLPILWPSQLSVSLTLVKCDHFDSQFLYVWLSLTISTIRFLNLWLRLSVSMILGKFDMVWPFRLSVSMIDFG